MHLKMSAKCRLVCWGLNGLTQSDDSSMVCFIIGNWWLVAYIAPSHCEKHADLFYFLNGPWWTYFIDLISWGQSNIFMVQSFWYNHRHVFQKKICRLDSKVKQLNTCPALVESFETRAGSCQSGISRSWTLSHLWPHIGSVYLKQARPWDTCWVELGVCVCFESLVP